MDCKSFRNQHLAYLDDTLSGEKMSAALRHVMACNGCAAHDTLVRRSLMVARSIPTLEPSADFQARLRARLAECRAQQEAQIAPDPSLFGGRLWRGPRTVVAAAVTAVFGVVVWNGLQDTSAPELTMQPVVASQPALAMPSPYITPALMQAMATGNPVWPAAMLIDDAPTYFVSAEFSIAEMR